MICQSFIYIVTILLIQTPQHSTEQCANYYLLLEKQDISPVWKPTQISKVSWTYEMNRTEEYNIIQNNLDCVLELNCELFIADNHCKPPTNTDNQAGHELILTGSTKLTTFSTLSTDDTTNTRTSLVQTTHKITTIPPTPDRSTITTPTLSQSTSENTSKGSFIMNTSVAPGNTSFPTEPTSITNISNNNTLKPSNPETTIIILEVSSTTHVIDTTVNPYYNEAVQLNEKRKARMRIAATVIGGLAGTSLLIFLLKWCKDTTQSGTYRVPAPTVDESQV